MASILGYDKQVRSFFDNARKKVLKAAVKSVNVTAFMVRGDLQAEIRKVFDKPTPYIERRTLIVKRATDATPTATVGHQYIGGKGVDPARVLAAEVSGGPRRPKAAEVALRRVGILPPGYYLVPGDALPEHAKDGFGGVKGSFLVQILSYFQAMGEQGYSANMTARRKKAIAKHGKTERGFKTINGVVYLVSHGDARNRTRHLEPGIWGKRGIHGSDIFPVLMFVRQPIYQRRYDMRKVADRTVSRNLQRIFDGELKQAGITR